VPRWTRPLLGALIGALVLLALGFGLVSAAGDQQTAAPSDMSVAATPPAGTSAPASSINTVVSAVLGAMALFVAVELVVFLAAATHIVASSRRIGSSWLRAPPVVA
jgi:hypothetical protein